MLTGHIAALFGFLGGLASHYIPTKKKKPKQRVFRPAEEYHEPRRTRITPNLDQQTFEKELKRMQKQDGSV